MEIEKTNLLDEPQTTSRDDLLKAVDVLNKHQYQTYKNNQSRAMSDLEEIKLVEHSSGDEVRAVRFTRYPDAPPHLFPKEGMRCTCP